MNEGVIFRNNLIIGFIGILFILLIYKISVNLCVSYVMSDNTISTQILSNKFCQDTNNTDNKIDGVLKNSYKNIYFLVDSKVIL